MLIEAATQEEFEQNLSQGEFDLVLSDFNILGFEGLDVLARVQEQSPDTPVVIVTGTGSEEVAVKALRSGAADYVIKTPEHIRHLPYTLSAVLEKVKLRKARRQSAEDLRRALEDSTRRTRELEALLEGPKHVLTGTTSRPSRGTSSTARGRSSALPPATWRC